MHSKLSRPVADFIHDSGLPADLVVTGLQMDSRRIERGNLFLAVPGTTADGSDYIGQAIEKGASCIICEDVEDSIQLDGEVHIVRMKNLSARLGEIASCYYGDASRSIKIVAITGTNGKTSCCHYLEQALNLLGVSCGLMGTLGYGVAGQIKTFGLTTPDVINFHKYLAEMKSDGAKIVALEASSHGLSQGRLDGAVIDIAVFTNLTRDHLDYHQTLEAYQNSKKKLFLRDEVKTAVLNLDDSYGKILARELSEQLNVITYSTESNASDVSCTDIKQEQSGVSAIIHTPWGSGLLTSKLYGLFNLSNLLTVVCVLGNEGYELSRILEVLAKLENVKGRMDRVPLGTGLQVVIDYAHTPDALENVLQTLRHHCDGRLWCVFGCGGDRDKGKRPEMGGISEQFSDYVVLTNDNPRTEPADQIIRDILVGIENNSRVLEIPDRGAAIRYVINKADVGDVLLIAGKGHEDYQDIGGVKIPYSDYDEVNLAVG